VKLPSLQQQGVHDLLSNKAQTIPGIGEFVEEKSTTTGDLSIYLSLSLYIYIYILYSIDVYVQLR
jgi:hypothetical protein